jgi:D-glycerate 3-kinase
LSLDKSAKNTPSPLPHYETIVKWIEEQRMLQLQRPLFIGINAPQGAGKTTLCQYLDYTFQSAGIRSTSISIDDFYLTRAQQMALATFYAKNVYLQQRGYPGTHDMALGIETLQKLAALNDSRIIPVPVYDKSQHQGQGDRLPLELWSKVQGPLDIVFVEGWMLGFRPIADSQIQSSELKTINRFLKTYSDWTTFLHCFIHLEASPMENVIAWRIEAEKVRRQSGRPAMTENETQSYINLFMPAYQTYVPGLIHQPPVSEEHCLHLKLGLDRRPIWN